MTRYLRSAETLGWEKSEELSATAGYKEGVQATYLLGGLEDVTPEDVGGGVTGDVRKYLEILGVVRHVEDSVDGVTHDEELVLVQVSLFLRGERGAEG